MKSIAILLLNGGIASTAILPYEIFSSAGRLWNLLNGTSDNPQFDVATASLTGERVRTDGRLALTPEHSFKDLERPDIVFVPAGGLELDVMLRDGYDINEVIRCNVEVVAWLKTWAMQGVKIAAVCSGVVLPAAGGLLSGKRATAHWGLIERYRAYFPDVDWCEQYLVTDAGDIYCGGGVNAAADLSLYLVEKFCGREIALETAQALMLEMPRTWQTSFAHFSPRVAHDDVPIMRAQQWLQNHYAEDVSFEEVAQRFGMSGRNFARRFKTATGDSPLGYLQGLRVAIAKQMLENAHVTVKEVAEKVGYVDLIFFRSLFRRHTGISPNEYRRRFG